MRKSEHQGNDFKESCSKTEVSEQVYYTARLQRSAVQSFVDVLAVRSHSQCVKILEHITHSQSTALHLEKVLKFCKYHQADSPS